ncbi:flippase [Campylobacter sp. VBCF_06 NA8]|uniref:flippase n=1 Tax=Campylobacter sp. VBCF_06 NA8 TaxID=2983822 RepID=UPI0022E9E830|nr:flippase [Campylobacter sp. VBCF_06 NA8]MDA3046004.1 flippase [Campylobacter sp. VBCF_06 NA8]
MQKSLVKNYIYNLSYEILVILLPLITIPYLARVLGAENLGIYSFTLSISTYFILFGSLGIALYGKREIAFVQNDKEAYTKLFWELLILRFLSMIVSIVIFYILFVYKINEYSIYYKILLLEMFAAIIDISWFFQGLEEFKKVVIRNTIVKLISVACIFIFVKSSDDLSIYFFIYVFGIIFGNLTLWLYLPKFLNKCKFVNLDIKKHIKPTITLFIPQIAIQVYTVLDKTMIGAIIDDKSEVGFYDQAQRILKILLTIITALGAVMLPRIASFFAGGETDKIKEYLEKSFSLVFLLSIPMIFGIFIIADDFVPIFFGNGFERVAILMCLMSPILLLIGLSNVIGMQYLLPTKRQKEFTISILVGAAINFLINLLLIPTYGALGAAVGTLVAEFCVTFTQFYFVRKDFEIMKIFKNARNYIFASVIMFVCCIEIKIQIIQAISIILKICIGTFIYFIFLILLKDDFLIATFQHIKIKFKGNQND